jgi:hypothetical protein
MTHVYGAGSLLASSTGYQAVLPESLIWTAFEDCFSLSGFTYTNQIIRVQAFLCKLRKGGDVRFFFRFEEPETLSR